jgi:hypothetical protein
MFRQPISPTLIVSPGDAVREEKDAAEDRGAVIAASAAEDLMKVLLFIFMRFKKYG